VRLFALAGALFLVAAITACGAGEDSNAVEKPRSKMSAAEIAKLPPITIRTQHGPKPRGLVVHDLRQGSGAVMKVGDTMLINWAETSYGEGLEAAPNVRQLEFTFGKFIEGWEDGLPGMKVGGRRELIVPPRLGDTGVTTVYVVDLLGIKPG
jgi:peptidylprolyl isomerase